MPPRKVNSGTLRHTNDPSWFPPECTHEVPWEFWEEDEESFPEPPHRGWYFFHEEDTCVLRTENNASYQKSKDAFKAWLEYLHEDEGKPRRKSRARKGAKV